MPTEKKFVNFNAYELCTPKFFGTTYDRDRYDHEQVEFLLKEILKVRSLEERAFHYNDKVINLIECKDSDDQDFLEGYFTSARYGQKQEIIDVITQKKEGDKEKTHGVKNESYFVIDKRNGLLLVQRDSQGVVSRDMLHRFFVYHRDLAAKYREVFNKENVATITKNAYLKVATLPSKEFFDELDNFVRIREAFMIVDREGINNEGIEYLANEAEENGVEDFQEMKISLKNNVKKGHIKHIKAFFHKLVEEDKYDNYGVTGVYESGKSRTISMAKIPQSFDREITHNADGQPSISELISSMVNIAKTENPIIDKNEGRKTVRNVGGLIDRMVKKEEEIGESEAHELLL